MTAVLQMLAIGALAFMPQDLPDMPADVSSGYRLADLDDNGEQDLILPHAVYFQNNNAFSALTKTGAPVVGAPATCDVWNGTLYLRLPGRLQVCRWEGRGWHVLADQPVAWPNPGNEMLLPVYAAAAGLKFERLLHDIDGDETPEIFAPDEGGLRVFRRAADGRFLEAALFEVFPPLQVAPVEGQQLWPSSARGVTFPVRAMKCRYNISGNEITVITREDCPTLTRGVLARYRVKRFVVDAAALEIVATETREEVSEPFAPHLGLIRLNGDARLDIAGGRLLSAKGSPAPAPIYETVASTDGGKSFTMRRARGFRPNQSFVDVNNDGRVDLVTETAGMFKGGMRETAGRFLTTPEIEHEVQVYLQDEQGDFAAEAGVRGTFDIALDSAPVKNGAMFGRYRAGGLFTVTGDFNGDGLNDALVQDGSARLAVFLGVPGGFEEHAAASIEAAGIERFSVGDYNGDGRSDILAQFRGQQKGSALEARLYIAGGDI